MTGTDKYLNLIMMDLLRTRGLTLFPQTFPRVLASIMSIKIYLTVIIGKQASLNRSEERRVGKECRL